MAGDNVWAVVAWGLLLSFLIKRMMFGPQKRFAVVSMTLIWIGEAAMIVSAAVPSLSGPGSVVETAGMCLAAVMVLVDWKWRAQRMKKGG